VIKEITNVPNGFVKIRFKAGLGTGMHCRLVEKKMTVTQMKQILGPIVGIVASRLNLMYEGRSMRDNSKFEDIEDNDIVVYMQKD